MYPVEPNHPDDLTTLKNDCQITPSNEKNCETFVPSSEILSQTLGLYKLFTAGLEIQEEVEFQFEDLITITLADDSAAKLTIFPFEVFLHASPPDVLVTNLAETTTNAVIV